MRSVDNRDLSDMDNYQTARIEVLKAALEAEKKENARLREDLRVLKLYFVAKARRVA
jgi:hypothetical protein